VHIWGILCGRLAIPPPDCGGLSARQCLCNDGCVAYDEGLAARLFDILGEEAGLAEKKMFGGLAVLLDGEHGRRRLRG